MSTDAGVGVIPTCLNERDADDVEEAWECLSDGFKALFGEDGKCTDAPMPQPRRPRYAYLEELLDSGVPEEPDMFCTYWYDDTDMGDFLTPMLTLYQLAGCKEQLLRVLKEVPWLSDPQFMLATLQDVDDEWCSKEACHIVPDSLWDIFEQLPSCLRGDNIIAELAVRRSKDNYAHVVGVARDNPNVRLALEGRGSFPTKPFVEPTSYKELEKRTGQRLAAAEKILAFLAERPNALMGDELRTVLLEAYEEGASAADLQAKWDAATTAMPGGVAYKAGAASFDAAKMGSKRPCEDVSE